jgi:hypothetical protein
MVSDCTQNYWLPCQGQAVSRRLLVTEAVFWSSNIPYCVGSRGIATGFCSCSRFSQISCHFRMLNIRFASATVDAVNPSYSFTKALRDSRDISLLCFYTSALEEGEGLALRPVRFLPRKRPGTHCTGGWVGPRDGLDRCGKSRPHRDSINGPSSP